MNNTDAEPGLVSDPAADGLPEVADDDSYADDVHEAERDASTVAAALPPDRDDGPLALDDYGTTAEERFRGEPLDRRLARELPDTQPDPEPLDVSSAGVPDGRVRRPARASREDPDPGMAEDVDPDAVTQLPDDTRLLAEEDPVDPRLGSVVSMYDRPVPGIWSGAPVGRLTRADGGYVSNDSDEIADDAGDSAGGFGSEELAVHEIPEEQARYEEARSAAERRGAPPSPTGPVRSGPFRISMS